MEGTVYIDKGGKVNFVSGKMDKSGAAYGYYNNTLTSTGWGVLDIKAGHSSSGLSNKQIMYAAGYLEGVFTARYVIPCSIVMINIVLLIYIYL